MNYLKYIFILLSVWVNCAFATGPDDDIPTDTIALDEVAITANRLIYFTAGAKIQKINAKEIKNYQNENLSSLLSEITGITVKSYGASGVSNISLRGMSSKHTAVLWNGMNIQNNMNGGVDMNSIPTFLIDEIDIQYGGSGALFGSGAVGGAIHLNTILTFTNDLDVQYSQSIGSYDNYFEGLKFKFSTSKFANNTRIYHKYGKNDYEYKNTQQFGHPTDNLKNSAALQYGLLQSNAYRINSSHQIHTNIWLQHQFIEIPNIMTNLAPSLQNQDTDNARVSVVWNYNREKSFWFTRLYYDYQSQIYRNPSISLISEMDNSALIGEVENKTSLGNYFLLNTGINHTYDYVNTLNYGTRKERNRTALYSSLKYFNTPKTFTAILSVREEMVDNELSPFTFSFSTRYFIADYLNVSANVSRNYNTPSFNDLYWVPGGNPDLNTETGWSEDVGITCKKAINQHTVKAELSAFNINLNNHVIWLPTGVSGNWNAENIENLWSRGIESTLLYGMQISKLNLQTNLQYQYTKSTYEDSEHADPGSIGKQLMYVPKHKGSGTVNVSYRWIKLRYTHNYTGIRFITKDNSNSVDAYQIGDASIGTTVRFKSSDMMINFKVNNIWNTTYEVMSNYAMPLRHYTLCITYNFNKQFTN